MSKPDSELETRVLEIISGRKVLVLCLGSELMGDDAAGLEVCKSLLDSEVCDKVIIGGVAPENFSMEIVEKGPEVLVIVDSVDAGLSPGSIILAEPPFGDLRLVSTHSLPLDLFVSVLRSELKGLRVILIGIQVARIEVGSNITQEVRRSVAYVTELLKRALQETHPSNL